MRKLFIFCILCSFFILPVSALDMEAPTAPEAANEYMPPNTQSFSEGLLYVFKMLIHRLQPSIAEASGVCLSVIAAVLLCSILHTYSGGSKRTTQLVGAISIGLLLFNSSNSLLSLGVDTVKELTDYGKLLLPVMAGALAAQGGATSSTALYAGTALFSSLLSSVVYRLIVPLLYVNIALGISNSALGQSQLTELQKFVKWLMVWILKIVLYTFTGYMSVTGVITGSVDAAAIKATKLTISGVVPMVGGIIADASETILVSASVVKNGIGVYGMLAVVSVLAGPFLRLGVQYLLLKLTTAVCGVFGEKRMSGLVKDFTGVMGHVLAMVCTVGLLLMVSIVCFMKGLS